MGGDGGVIATKRAYFVKRKKAAEKRDPVEVAAQRWNTCALTNEVLRSPIVADELGLLYNKDSVIAHLLSRKPFPKQLRHIKGLKNLINVKFTANPAAEEGAKAAAGTEESAAAGVADSAMYWRDTHHGKYICPISRQETSGKYPFVVYATCGHVVSEKARKELPQARCLVCDKPYEPLDVIPLCPTDDNMLVHQKERMVARRKGLKAAKKARKALAANSKTRPSEGAASKSACEVDGSAAGAGAGAGVGAGAGAGAPDATSGARAAAKRADEQRRKDRKREKKERRKRGLPDESEAAAQARRKAPRVSAAASSITAKALAAIEASRKNSQVYNKLFTKDSDKPKDSATAGANLFIRVATNIYGQSREY